MLGPPVISTASETLVRSGSGRGSGAGCSAAGGGRGCSNSNGGATVTGDRVCFEGVVGLFPGRVDGEDHSVFAVRAALAVEPGRVGTGNGVVVGGYSAKTHGLLTMEWRGGAGRGGRGV